MECWCEIFFTIRILLVRVRREAAVVPVIWDTIVVIVRITSIPFSITVMISLIGVGNVRTVVLVILVTIFIYVLIVVTLVPNQVIIHIRLKAKIDNKIRFFAIKQK